MHACFNFFKFKESFLISPVGCQSFRCRDQLLVRSSSDSGGLENHSSANVGFWWRLKSWFRRVLFRWWYISHAQKSPRNMWNEVHNAQVFFPSGCTCADGLCALASPYTLNIFVMVTISMTTRLGTLFCYVIFSSVVVSIFTQHFASGLQHLSYRVQPLLSLERIFGKEISSEDSWKTLFRLYNVAWTKWVSSPSLSQPHLSGGSGYAFLMSLCASLQLQEKELSLQDDVARLERSLQSAEARLPQPFCGVPGTCSQSSVDRLGRTWLLVACCVNGLLRVLSTDYN